MSFKVKISEDKKKLFIEMDIEEVILPSKKTGKTLLVASTHGTHKTGAIFNGGELRFSGNLFIPNPAYKKQKKQAKNNDFNDPELSNI